LSLKTKVDDLRVVRPQKTTGTVSPGLASKPVVQFLIGLSLKIDGGGL
jgi:hypothetical protein